MVYSDVYTFEPVLLFWEIHPERCGQYLYIRTPGGSDSKNVPAMQETKVRSLGWEDTLEKGMATDSNILAWRIPWTE